MTFNIRKFLGLCEHNWVQIDKMEVNAYLPSDRKNTEHTVGYIYVLRCKLCGNIKKKQT